VRFDFQYISDSLWNVESDQRERLASWNRFRGTEDIDFGSLIGQQCLYCPSQRCSMKEFHRVKKAASFTIDQAMEKMEAVFAGGSAAAAAKA
jgi:hypothetical protein